MSLRGSQRYEKVQNEWRQQGHRPLVGDRSQLIIDAMRSKNRKPSEMKHSAGPLTTLSSTFSMDVRSARGNGSGTTTVIPSVPEPAASSTFSYWEPPTSWGSRALIY